MDSNKIRRVTKPGCWFAGLREMAYLSIVVGGLAALGGLIGVVAVTIRTAPQIVSLFQHLDDKFGLFVLTLFATYFGVFGSLTCTGLLGVGLGFLLNLASTEPESGISIDKPFTSA